MNDIVMSISYVILVIICAFITKIAIPLIKSRLSNAELETIQTWVGIAVMAAEQLYKDTQGAGETKYAYVSAFLMDKGINVTETELKMLIESAVKAMNDFYLEE